jgi:hypothetical protein
VNLDFFGVGKGLLNGAPAGYNVEALFGIVEARYRIASCRSTRGCDTPTGT